MAAVAEVVVTIVVRLDHQLALEVVQLDRRAADLTGSVHSSLLGLWFTSSRRRCGGAPLARESPKDDCSEPDDGPD